ncbi:hypothetical protein D3C77_394450 [compost metagenome]
MRVDDCIGEYIYQYLATGAQRLHRCQAVVDGVGPTAVGVHHQVAIQPTEGGAYRSIGACTGFTAGSDCRDCQYIVFKVDVVAEHIAAGVEARRRIVQSARLDSSGSIINAIGHIIASDDDDRQLREVGETASVGHLVGEFVDHCLQQIQRQNGRVGAVDVIGVAAVGIDYQCAILADQHIANRAGHPRATFRTGTNAGHCKYIALVNIAVVRQHIAAGVDGQAIAIIGHGKIDVVSGHRGIPRALNGQAELGDVLGPGSVAHAIGEHLLKGIARFQGLDGSQCVVDLIAIIAVGKHRQGAVYPRDGLRAGDCGEGATCRFAARANAIDGLAVTRIDVSVIA